MNDGLAAASVVASWMRDVLAEKRWSATFWARQAGVSASSITRVIAGTTRFETKPSTIEKLATIAGRWPDGWSGPSVKTTVTALALEAMLKRIFRFFPQSPSKTVLRAMSEAMEHGIATLTANSGDFPNAATIEIAAYQAAARFAQRSEKCRLTMRRRDATACK